MPMEVDYWEVCRLWLNAEGKVAVTARARTLGYYVDCFDWASKISLKRPNEVHWLIADTYVYPHYLLLPELKRNGMKAQAARMPPDETDESRADGQPDGNHPQVKRFTCRVLFCTDLWNLTDAGGRIK